MGFFKDIWHKEVPTLAALYGVAPRRWGMTATVITDPTPGNNTTWILAYNLSSTNKQDNANWQKLSDYIGGGAGSTFPANVTFVLSGGKTFGKYTNGQTANWAGLTAVQAMLDAAIEYINPAFTSFTYTGYANTVEVGTTISGIKTFTWAINNNSGIVLTIDIYDNTAGATLLAGTPNDGSQPVVVATIQLNANGATQSWKGIANNTSPVGTDDSPNLITTARFFRFLGPTAATPVTSADVRALASTFHTGASTFILNTGTVQTKFVCALPPGVTIASVFDLDALNANITAQYVLLGTINVLDAGGTNRAYNLYEMDLGAAYSSNHRHSITTVN
jgi:hypothetical protein